MNADGLLALLPLLLITAASVVVMLAIAVRRSHRLTLALTVLGFLAGMLVLPISAELAPVTVTPLILIDRYSVFFMALLFAGGLAICLLCYDYFKAWDGEKEELYLLILTAILGASVLVSSNHFAAFFLGLETLSVSLFALIAYTVRRKRALEAAVKYVILSGVSSAFLLFGIALIYSQTGSLSFPEIAQAMTGASQVMEVIGAILIIAGLGFKLSLVPFHMWTPDVYEGAPVPITAFLATVSKGAILAMLLRYLITTEAYLYEPLNIALTVIAIASILIGNWLALLQKDIKRLLAYSSIAHFGYLLVALVAGAIIGPQLMIETVSFYLFAYFITSIGAFGVVTILSSPQQEAASVDHYLGLFWRRPGLAIILTAMLMSLAGIPLTAGFVGKFYIFVAGAEGNLWLLLMVLIAGSAMGLYYYLRIVLAMFSWPQEQVPATYQTANPFLSQLTVTLLALLLLGFGIMPGPLTELIQAMAKTLD